MSAIPIKKVNWWHQSIIDWELANPHQTMNECAAFFDVSPSWLSTVRNSDAFRAYAALRRAEHNENVSLGITGQLQQLAKEAVGEMLDRVQNEREKLEFSEIQSAGALALKALGFGAGAMGNPNRIPDRSGSTTHITNNVLITATPDALARARAKMAALSSPLRLVTGDGDSAGADHTASGLTGIEQMEQMEAAE